MQRQKRLAPKVFPLKSSSKAKSLKENFDWTEKSVVWEILSGRLGFAWKITYDDSSQNDTSSLRNIIGENEANINKNDLDFNRKTFRPVFFQGIIDLNLSESKIR